MIRRAIADFVAKIQGWSDRRGTRVQPHDPSDRERLDRILSASPESVEPRRVRPFSEKASKGWERRPVR